LDRVVVAAAAAVGFVVMVSAVGNVVFVVFVAAAVATAVVVAVVVVVVVVVVTVVAVVVVVVVLVVGHMPSPGWQSGTSTWSGHCVPVVSLLALRVTAMIRAAPASHAFVHVLNEYAQSARSVVVVAVVVVVVVVVPVVVVVVVVVMVVVVAVVEVVVVVVEVVVVVVVVLVVVCLTGTDTVSSINVTLPVCANSLPLIVTLADTVTDAYASTVPTNVVPPFRVALLPTAQNTLAACPPPTSLMWLLVTAVVSELPIWNVHTPLGSPPASSVRVPVMARLDEAA